MKNTVIYYSPANDAFYPDNLLYEAVPADVEVVSKEDFITYSLSQPPSGKRRGRDSHGKFCWVTSTTIETATPEQSERDWRDSQLILADIEIYKIQDTDSNAQGSVSAWRSYRKSLRHWPEHQNFPNKASRPKAPDFKE
jgi:hypothetical protein